MTRRTAGCVSISGAAAGVVTTSTGPWRAASTSSSGVVSTTSPRKAVWMTRLVNLQDRQERLLWDLDRSHLLHALLSFFLLLEQLALARHVAPIALGGDVLRNGRTVSRAITLVPIAAWITTSNSWRGISSFSFSAIFLPHSYALSRWMMTENASTASPLSSMSSLTRSAGRYARNS